MSITVFGATGDTGRAFLHAAARAGHDTTAFVRDPARLQDAPAGEVVRGDVFDPGDVRRAVDGAQAVLVLLGLKGGERRTPLYSRGTSTITDAMQAAGVRRLLVLSEAAYPPHTTGAANALLNALYGAFAAPLIRERRRQDEVLAASNLDWTVVRPGVLSDAPTARPPVPRLSPHGSLLARTSRPALCDLLLAVLDDPTTHRRSVYP